MCGVCGVCVCVWDTDCCISLGWTLWSDQNGDIVGFQDGGWRHPFYLSLEWLFHHVHVKDNFLAEVAEIDVHNFPSQ